MVGARGLWFCGSIACAGGDGAAPLAAARGVEAPGVVGRVRPGPDGPRVWLVGPRWATPGEVPAQVESGADGTLFLAVPLRVGPGEGEAVLRMQGQALRVPLGGRAGEHDLAARLTEVVPDDAALGGAAAAAAARIDADAAGWSAGDLLLYSGDALVGGVTLRGPEAPAALWLEHPAARTVGLVAASRADEDGDLLLAFPVEPALSGEEGLVRLNVATGEAVLPAGPHPDPGDLRLRWTFGAVDAAAREAAAASAAAAAFAREQAFFAETVRPSLAGLRGADGACRAPAAVEPAWELLLAGYAVRAEADGAGGCVLQVEPLRAQHGRRWRGRVDAAGAHPVDAPPGAPAGGG